MELQIILKNGISKALRTSQESPVRLFMNLGFSKDYPILQWRKLKQNLKIGFTENLPSEWIRKATKLFHQTFVKSIFLLRPLQVRHPLSRILSAYLDKFDSRNTVVAEYYMRWFGRFIIKNYQGGKHNPVDQNYKGIIILYKNIEL